MEKTHGLNIELLQDILQNIAEANEELVANCDIHIGFFKEKNHSPFILSLCKTYKLTDEAKFLSIEMFDKFMSVVLRKLNKEVNEKTNQDWKEDFQKVKSQLILNVLSCIQLSNKLCSSDIFIKCSDIKEFLDGYGYDVNLASIMNSELKVMKYLDYKLNIPTPFNFMQVLLAALSNNCNDLNINILSAIANKVFECFYCQRNEIYDRLYESMTGRSRDLLDREKFLVIESNHLYLSSSVIIASAYIYRKSIYEMVLDALTFLTKMDKYDLDDFSVILCHFTIGKS